MSENQTTVQFDDPIDEFLNQLENDQTKPREFNNAVKINMAFSDNQGMVMFAPYQGEVDGRKSFYTLIPGVKEYKCAVSMIDDAKTPLWVRILPKEFYGELTNEQSDLYDQVSNLFDQVRESHDEGDSWKVIRTRSYSLFYGILLKHVSRNGQEVRDNIGKPVLFVFPSKAPVSELATSIKNQTTALNGNRTWVSRIFAAKEGSRGGAVIINFERPETGGYSSTVQFVMNSDFSKVVESEYPEEITKMFKDPVEDFLGWENGKEAKFQSELFKELKKIFMLELNDPGKPEEVVVENKNGVDPMLKNDAPAPTEAPIETPTEAPKIEGEENLPF